MQGDWSLALFGQGREDVIIEGRNSRTVASSFNCRRSSYKFRPINFLDSKLKSEELRHNLSDLILDNLGNATSPRTNEDRNIAIISDSSSRSTKGFPFQKQKSVLRDKRRQLGHVCSILAFEVPGKTLIN